MTTKLMIGGMMDPTMIWNNILTQLELGENPRESTIELLTWLNKGGFCPSVKFLGSGGIADKYVVLATLEKILEDYKE